MQDEVMKDRGGVYERCCSSLPSLMRSIERTADGRRQRYDSALAR
jgi:hypothetical protein